MGTLLSALLLAACFPPWNQGWVVFVALVPFIRSLRSSRTAKQAVAQGLWLAILLGLAVTPWMVGAIVYELHVSKLAAATLLTIGSFTVGQPQFVVMAPLIRWVKRLPGAEPGSAWGAFSNVWIALAYCGLDWMLPKIFHDTLGHLLHLSPVLRQSADLGGPRLLTFLILLVSLALEDFVFWARRAYAAKPFPPIKAAAQAWGWTGALVLTLAIASGVYGWRRLTPGSHGASLRVALVQPNWQRPESERTQAERQEFRLGRAKTFYSVSSRLLSSLPRPDLLIWPENTYWSNLGIPRSPQAWAYRSELQKFVSDHATPLILGSTEGLDRRMGNLMYLVEPGGSPSAGMRDPASGLQFFEKRRPFPMGESIPLAEVFPSLRALFGKRLTIPEGSEGGLISARIGGAGTGSLLQIGPAICYDDVFPEFSIEAARRGARILLTILNDAPFGTGAESEMHQMIALFRAIETRLPQLRVASTGVTAVIDSRGEVRARAEANRQEIVRAEVPLNEPEWTLMKAWGDWFGPFGLFAAVGGSLGYALASRRRRGAGPTPASLGPKPWAGLESNH